MLIALITGMILKVLSVRKKKLQGGDTLVPTSETTL